MATVLDVAVEHRGREGIDAAPWHGWPRLTRETSASWTLVLTSICVRSGICISFWPSRTGSPWATIDCCEPPPPRACSGT